jgi:hypothetical protein
VKQRDYLQQRKDELLGLSAAQRHQLGEEFGNVLQSAGRVDSWLALARRLTPVAAAGLAVITIIAGPSRVLRLVRGSLVPALVFRQFFPRRR